MQVSALYNTFITQILVEALLSLDLIFPPELGSRQWLEWLEDDKADTDLIASLIVRLNGGLPQDAFRQHC